MGDVSFETNPPSARSTRAPVLSQPLFDLPRLLSFVRAGLLPGLPPLQYPNDELLIATVIHYGMPRWSAEQMRGNPNVRYHFACFWADVQEAAKGNKEAKERVDVCRAAWSEMRKIELISDKPDHTIGLWER